MLFIGRLVKDVVYKMFIKYCFPDDFKTINSVKLNLLNTNDSTRLDTASGYFSAVDLSLCYQEWCMVSVICLLGG